MSLIDTLLRPIEELFNRIFGGTVVGRLLSKIRDGISHTLTLFERIDALIASIKAEITGFRNWKEDFQIKNKVINLPKAVERTADLAREIRDAWNAIGDIIRDLKEKTRGGNPEAEAEAAAKDIESGGIGEGLLKRLPRVARGLERILGVVTLIVDAIISWSDLVDKAQLVVNAIHDLRLEVETGSTIFLFQGNRRRTVTLDDGTTMKIRLGNLHT